MYLWIICDPEYFPPAMLVVSAKCQSGGEERGTEQRRACMPGMHINKEAGSMSPHSPHPICEALVVVVCVCELRGAVGRV